ncbi:MULTISPECIES: DUF6844 domain-containing protein [Achromobacter]|uniref:DUF6844 domain-containing protein n=1 Tax=Achromobacter TaxID=222 RepID=UPI001CBD0CA6|nr:hypothetical protein [Achromobacter mucicolens]UAN02419.1 hypothetical protein K9D24_26255 [Achromobacter mucicolens]
MSKFTPIVLALSLLAAAGTPMQTALAQTPAQPAAQPAAGALAVTPVPGQAPEALLDKATGANAMGDEPVQSYEDWVAEFEEQFGQAMGKAQDGRVFYAGFAPLSVDSAANPHYGTQLALAYERAVFDMQADYILSTYGRLTTQTILTRFEDQSSNKDVFDPVELEAALKAGGGRLEALIDKALTLLDKKLDNALVEEGVPAEDVKKMTVEQKKTLFKDNLSKSVTKSAYQNMQGLVPVQTRIFSQTANGKKAMLVAVIAVQSEKTRQFAQDIARKRPTLVKGDPKVLKDLLPANEKGYLNEVGLRFTYDEAGRPMLLSYGRASVPMDPSWSASRAIRAKQTAQGIAQAMAEANIVAFMNNNIQISENTETGDVNEDLARQVTEIENGKVGQSQQIKEQIAETIQKRSRTGTASASGELRGTSVVKRWSTQDGNGVEHVGTVVGWTYGQLENANAIDAQMRGRGNGAQPNGAAATATDQNRSSKSINSKHDF